MTITTQKRNCSDCGLLFDFYDIEWNGAVVIRQERCDKCVEARQKALKVEEKLKVADEQIKAREEAFKTICPPLYQNTDPSRLHPEFRNAAMNWCYGPKGLGLVGIAGTGKTRAAYMLLKRMASDGRKVEATNATCFSQLCVDQFADDKEIKRATERKLKSIYQSDVWLLDDLGKQRMTERGETDLYSILEHRTTQMLPTIWTANAKSLALMKMFSADRGDPIMRRLTEFSQVVDVWK